MTREDYQRGSFLYVSLLGPDEWWDVETDAWTVQSDYVCSVEVIELDAHGPGCGDQELVALVVSVATPFDPGWALCDDKKARRFEWKVFRKLAGC